MPLTLVLCFPESLSSLGQLSCFARAFHALSSVPVVKIVCIQDTRSSNYFDSWFLVRADHFVEAVVSSGSFSEVAERQGMCYPRQCGSNHHALLVVLPLALLVVGEIAHQLYPREFPGLENACRPNAWQFALSTVTFKKFSKC